MTSRTLRRSVWELSVVQYGNFQSSSIGTLRRPVWELSVVQYGNFQSSSMGTFSRPVWELSVVQYGNFASSSMRTCVVQYVHFPSFWRANLNTLNVVRTAYCQA